MARAGLGLAWRCLFANDIDVSKAASYRANWPPALELHIGDIALVNPSMLPGAADLAWGSFPCQDLSLAGGCAGLSGTRSGTFWPWWNLMRALMGEGRGPKVIAIENVVGALTSRSGRDFQAIAEAFHAARYSYGAVIMDARHWVPQSRPRLFVVAVRGDLYIPASLCGDPSDLWHTRALRTSHAALSNTARSNWLWWAMPAPQSRSKHFIDVIEDQPTGVEWHSEAETRYTLDLMADVNRLKVDRAIAETYRSGDRMIGGVYRRTRNGRQRAEVRFDGVSGCIRTPVGGSSRQTILLIEQGRVRSRLLSPREATRLMGLPDTYILPANYNTAYHLAGDGVVVPAVRHLAEHVVEPVLAANAAFAVAAE